MGREKLQPLTMERRTELLEAWHQFSAPATDERVRAVEASEYELSVALMDGRTISVPLVWYLRLLNASETQRGNWRISGGEYGIHWPDAEEDLSTEGLLRGAPASHRTLAEE